MRCIEVNGAKRRTLSPARELRRHQKVRHRDRDSQIRAPDTIEPVRSVATVAALPPADGQKAAPLGNNFGGRRCAETSFRIGSQLALAESRSETSDIRTWFGTLFRRLNVLGPPARTH